MKDTDSFDDGGTRAWRANRATWDDGRGVIDISAPSIGRLWRRAPISHVIAALLILGVLIPGAIIVFGVLGLVAFDALTR